MKGLAERLQPRPAGRPPRRCSRPARCALRLRCASCARASRTSRSTADAARRRSTRASPRRPIWPRRSSARGVPFREAYKAVGALVALAVRRGRSRCAAIGEARARSVHPAFDARGARALEPARAVAAKESLGGTGPRAVDAQIAWLRERAPGAPRARAPTRPRSRSRDRWPSASSPSRWSSHDDETRFSRSSPISSLAEAREVLALAARLKGEPQADPRDACSSPGARSRSSSRRRARARASRSRWACAQLGALPRRPRRRRAASSGAASRSATRRASSRATATRSSTARLARAPARDGDGARAGHQRALRRRAPGAGALRRLHDRGAARERRIARQDAIAFVGDGSSNMARSWLEAARLFGFHLVLAAPARATCPRPTSSRAPARTSRCTTTRATRSPAATS